MIYQTRKFFLVQDQAGFFRKFSSNTYGSASVRAPREEASRFDTAREAYQMMAGDPEDPSVRSHVCMFEVPE